MPQRSQHPLVYILLIWTSILSIVQLSFIAIFFTRGQSSNSSTVGHTSQLHSKSLPFEIHNFQATEHESPKSTIQWVAITESKQIIEKQESLQSMKDGNYLINLRVTLSACDGKRIPGKFHSVTLRSQGIARLIGWIDAQSNSTGLLSKIIFLAKGTEVKFIIEPPACINQSLTVTHLDIIWMEKLQF